MEGIALKLYGIILCIVDIAFPVLYFIFQVEGKFNNNYKHSGFTYIFA